MTKQKHFYLIRGLIREQAHWGRFLIELQSAFPEAIISTFDIPGAGIYYTGQSPLSIKKIVDHIRQDYLKARLEDEEAHLIAISLGGMIAVEWMKRYPDDFQAATLINTSLGGHSPIFHRLLPSALIYLMKVPFLKGRDKESRILRLVSNHKNVFDETLNLWEKIQHERPVSLGNTLRQLLAAATYRPGDFCPKIPVLIMAGAQDRMVDVSCSRVIAKKWNVPLVEHPTGGHDLTSDAPEWVAREIKKASVDSETEVLAPLS
jgi:pimeloyl-ACP methyl ester carboxylesterase